MEIKIKDVRVNFEKDTTYEACPELNCRLRFAIPYHLNEYETLMHESNCLDLESVKKLKDFLDRVIAEFDKKSK